MNTPPDRFREWLKTHSSSEPREVGVSRMFHTRDAEDMWGASKSSGWIEGGRLHSWHVTDNAAHTRKVLAEGVRAIEVPADDWRWTRELGPGFYISAVPGYWLGRSRAKWKFLDELEQRELEKLIDWLERAIRKQHEDRYISSSELETAERTLRYIRSGDFDKELLSSFAGQPYNLRFWRPAFLETLGIKPGVMPQVLKIEAEGWFAQVNRQPDRELLRALVEAGFDGVIQEAGMATNPEAVIWNPQAVKAEHTDEQTAAEVVSGPRHPKTPLARKNRYQRIQTRLAPSPQFFQFREMPELAGESRRYADAQAHKLAQDVLNRHSQHADLRATQGWHPDTLWFSYLAYEFEQNIVRWTRRVRMSSEALMRLGHAAMHAYRAWIGSRLPEQVRSVWEPMINRVIDIGIRFDADPYSQVNIIDRMAWKDEMRLLIEEGIDAGQFRTHEQLENLQIEPEAYYEPQDISRRWTDTLSETTAVWLETLHRWTSGFGGALQYEKTTSRRRPVHRFRVLGSMLEEAVMLQPEQMNQVVTGFSLALMRWVVRLMPFDRLGSIDFDLGPRPIPF